MSFGKAPCARNSLRLLSKSQEVAYEIERLLESRGVAPLAAKALIVGTELGKGRFKKVHQGRLRQRSGLDCQDVVVLRYPKKDSEVRELDTLAVLAGHAHSSSFVPEVFGVVNDRSAASIVQERAPFGTLKNCLETEDRGFQLTLAHKLHAGVHITRALSFLESLHIVHADMACRNVLVFRLREDAQDLVAKITDFGLAVFLEDGACSAEVKQPQATRWCSPETVAYGRLSHQSDMWSFGVTMWELFSGGASPWPRFEKRADLISKLLELAETEAGAEVLSLDFPLPADECPLSVHHAFLSCLHADAECRPTAAELEVSLAKLFEEEMDVQLGSTGELDDAASAGVSTNSSLSVEPGLASAGVSTNASLSLMPGLSQSQYRSKLPSGKVQDATEREASAKGVDEKPRASSPIRELHLPRVHTSGPVRRWVSAPTLSIWTLWSLSENDALRRRDYVNKDDAQAAFQKDGGALSIVKQDVSPSL